MACISTNKLFSKGKRTGPVGVSYTLKTWSSIDPINIFPPFHPFEWMFCNQKQILSFKVRKFPMVISLPLSCLVGKGFRKKENLVYTFMRFVANFVPFSSTFCCWDKRRTIFFEPKTWAEEKWMSLVIILVFLSSYERAAVLEWSTLMLWISRIDLTCQ